MRALFVRHAKRLELDDQRLPTIRQPGLPHSSVGLSGSAAARRLLYRSAMSQASGRKVEVVSLRNGNSWAVMVGGRQAIVVTRREAALQIAEEIATYDDSDSREAATERARVD